MVICRLIGFRNNIGGGAFLLETIRGETIRAWFRKAYRYPLESLIEKKTATGNWQAQPASHDSV